jgi:ABC-2 type transport system ATP-binding protein
LNEAVGGGGSGGSGGGQPMLALSGLRKAFGQRVAVAGLDLVVEKGEIFGLLGPNGAGKSTTVNLVVGLLRPDAGSVRIGGGGGAVDDGDPRRPEVRRRIGVATQALALYEELTAAENLRFFGRLYGLEGEALERRVAWALDFVDLTGRAGDRVAGYSGGMKRRVNLAAALVHDPTLLLLDEPTVGVDPQSRNAILERVEALRDTGCTVIYTSHYMEEVERVCDRVAIVDHGKLLAVGTVAELIATHGGKSHLRWETDGGESGETELERPMEALRVLAGIPDVTSFHVTQPDLEDVFLHLTGRSLRD